MKRSTVSALGLGAALSACTPGGPAMLQCNVPATTVMHAGFISESERWASGTHVITSIVTVRDDVTLTVEGCARIQVAPNASLHVTGARARLVVDGTASAPVRVERLEPDRAWGSIFVRGTATANLRSVTITGGGTSDRWQSADVLGASLAAQGDAEQLPANITIIDSIVSDSNGIGVVMVASRFDPASSNLTIRGSGAYPLYIGADGATDIPTGDMRNNGIDEILLNDARVGVYSNTRSLVRDTVIRNRGLAYRVGIEGAGDGFIRVGDGRGDGPASVLLEIEPGVTMKFAPLGGNSGIFVQGHTVAGRWTTQGALRAVGTAERPIVFTSAASAPSAGNWTGLYFKDAIDPRTRVEHAVIEYAGGDSSARGVCASDGTGNIDADAAVIVSLDYGASPGSQFVTNTVIRASGNAGVYRNWDEVNIDFTPTNSFESVAGCRQSGVRMTRGGCSMTGCE